MMMMIDDVRKHDCVSGHRDSDTILLSTSSATIAVQHYDNNSRSYRVTVSARNRAATARFLADTVTRYDRLLLS